jgi:hypothetical protein
VVVSLHPTSSLTDKLASCNERKITHNTILEYIRQQASLGLLLLRQSRGSLSITTNVTHIYSSLLLQK